MRIVEDVDVQLVGDVVVVDLEVIKVKVVKMVNVDMVVVVMSVADHGSWKWILTCRLRPWRAES